MADIGEQYGLPVVTADTIFDCLRNNGSKRRKPIGEGVRAGKTRSVIFVLMPPGDSAPPDDLVLVSWERKRGAVILVHPSFSTAPSEEDRQSKSPMIACTARAFEEEAGITLGKIWNGEKLLSMGHSGGIPAGWSNSQRSFAYCGWAEPVARRELKPDDEKKKMPLVLVPLTEWLKLVCSRDTPDGFAVGDSAISVTFLALQRLRRFPVYWEISQSGSSPGEESDEDESEEDQSEEDAADPSFIVHLPPPEQKPTVTESRQPESSVSLWTAVATVAVISSLAILLTVWMSM